MVNAKLVSILSSHCTYRVPFILQDVLLSSYPRRPRFWPSLASPKPLGGRQPPLPTGPSEHHSCPGPHSISFLSPLCPVLPWLSLPIMVALAHSSPWTSRSAFSGYWPFIFCPVSVFIFCLHFLSTPVTLVPWCHPVHMHMGPMHRVPATTPPCGHATGSVSSECPYAPRIFSDPPCSHSDLPESWSDLWFPSPPFPMRYAQHSYTHLHRPVHTRMSTQPFCNSFLLPGSGVHPYPLLWVEFCPPKYMFGFYLLVSEM